jgi:hypothetical protein
MEFIKVN